jgi:hypothetical protein
VPEEMKQGIIDIIDSLQGQYLTLSWVLKEFDYE